MIRRRVLLGIALTSLAATTALASEEIPTSFLSSHYYILSLGEIDVDLQSLIGTVQTAAYSVVQFDRETVSVDRGPDTAETQLQEALEDPSVLVVDCERFYLASRGERYRFTVRPSAEGYELVIDPLVELALHDTLDDILTELFDLGVVGSEVNLQLAAFDKADLKGPPPPEGLPIDTTLYRLTVAADWFDFSRTNQIRQIGLRVIVVADKRSGESLDPSFAGFVDEETDLLVRFALPIDQLVPLARSSSVSYVRMPRQPFAP